jgi:glycine cleavage system aminomethyltransferase T
VVGTATSAGYGYTLGRTVAFAFLPLDAVGSGTIEIEAYGRTWPAIRGARSLYDPKGERLRR